MKTLKDKIDELCSINDLSCKERNVARRITQIKYSTY